MAFVNQRDANEWPGILKYIQDKISLMEEGFATLKWRQIS